MCAINSKIEFRVLVLCFVEDVLDSMECYRLIQISTTDEIVLARNIAMLGDWGLPLDSFDVRVLVRQYLDV